MSARAKFAQVDITRAVRGFLAAGIEVGGVRVAPNGEIIVWAKGQEQDPVHRPNPLDRLLHGSH